MASGCGCKEVYTRFPHITCLYSSCTCICSFLQQHCSFCLNVVYVQCHCEFYQVPCAYCQGEFGTRRSHCKLIGSAVQNIHVCTHLCPVCMLYTSNVLPRTSWCQGALRYLQSAM